MTTIDNTSTANEIGEHDAGEAIRKTLLLDVDVHPMFLPKDILPRLPEPWRSRVERAGGGRGSSQGAGQAYPRWRNGGYRVDAAVPGGFPGSDLGLMRTQLLDEYGTDVAVLIPLGVASSGPGEFQAAMCHAVNDWLATDWLDNDERLRGTLNVPFDYPELAVAEIERYASDKRFVQVMIAGGTESEWGSHRYWPIYAAAEAAGLVVMSHVGGSNNGYKGAGAPSYYLEQHVWLHNTTVRLAMSMICEGVFDAFPSLQIALIEACISWAGPLQWAMDAAYEVTYDRPNLSKPPSKYFQEHYWLSTQPIEEPQDARQLVHALEFTQMTDRIMFSSDYPHWDFDSPTKALPVTIPKEMREGIMHRNAAALYQQAVAEH